MKKNGVVKKYLFVSFILILLFITVSCDLSKKIAVLYIENNSSYQVTELFISSMAEKWAVDAIEPGCSSALVYVWVESDVYYGDLCFTMNGEEYGTKYQEEITAENATRYKTRKKISNGGTINLRIYNNHWEW